MSICREYASIIIRECTREYISIYRGYTITVGNSITVSNCREYTSICEEVLHKSINSSKYG
jgi:hypothetical protein